MKIPNVSLDQYARAMKAMQIRTKELMKIKPGPDTYPPMFPKRSLWSKLFRGRRKIE